MRFFFAFSSARAVWLRRFFTICSGVPVTTWGTGGVVSEDPSPLADGLAVIGADGAYLYLAGLENVDVSNGMQDQGWRIEKRTK